MARSSSMHFDSISMAKQRVAIGMWKLCSHTKSNEREKNDVSIKNWIKAANDLQSNINFGCCTIAQHLKETNISIIFGILETCSLRVFTHFSLWLRVRSTILNFLVEIINEKIIVHSRVKHIFVFESSSKYLLCKMKIHNFSFHSVFPSRASTIKFFSLSRLQAINCVWLWPTAASRWFTRNSCN